MSDELMDRLAATRPEMPDGLLAPDTDLLEEILMTDIATPRRFVTPLRLASVAALAAALVAVALVVPTRDNAGPKTLRAIDMTQIAESTSAALKSGRAHVLVNTKTDKIAPRVSNADFTVEFSGDNRSMFGTIDPGDGRSSVFSIANKVIDGQFYLQDGTRWVRDTNATGMTGDDIFSLDPRTFVTGAAQDAGFEPVGTETVDGATTRHLVAANPDKVPTLNVGLGPSPEVTITKFEVWVDDANVVRRVLMATKDVQQTYPNAQTRVVTGADGKVRKELDPATMGEPVDVTTITTTTVNFTDIGDPVTITPPPNAVPIAGKG
ncbi:MAG: hypothetical protein QOI61_2145 [Actinomycetota bacterium]